MSSPIPSQPLVLFDWDGTLAENYAVIKDGLNHVRAHFNLPLWSDEDAKKNIRLSARDHYHELFDDPEDITKAISLFLGYVDKKHLETIKAIAGAEAFLQRLKNQGSTLGVVSNKTQKFLDREIEKLGWAHYFDVAIGAGTAKRDKPQPDSIHLALSQLNVSTTDIYYIGDTDTDMLAAHRAEITPVFVTFGIGCPDDLYKGEFEPIKPDICNDYDAVYNVLYTKK
jgi:HAD superfamily hydrolase (TIGR01509 family)